MPSLKWIEVESNRWIAEAGDDSWYHVVQAESWYHVVQTEVAAQTSDVVIGKPRSNPAWKFYIFKESPVGATLQPIGEGSLSRMGAQQICERDFFRGEPGVAGPVPEALIPHK